MRKIILILAILSLSGTLWAADPIIGMWKLNVGKSKLPPIQQASKEQTETYRERADGQIELTYLNISQYGSSDLLIATFPIHGGMAKVQKGNIPFTIIQTRITQNEWCVTYMQDGKQIGTRHKEISEDGKTMHQTLRGIDEEGEPFEWLLVLERQ